MSNASNLSTLANVLDDGSDGQFLKSTGSGGVAFDTVAAGAVVYATADLLPLSGFSAGDMAYVTATNRFYINNGSGWYNIALVNLTPTIASDGVKDQTNATIESSVPFSLSTDQSTTIVTVTATDSEEVPLTFNKSVTVQSGAIGSTTVVQGTGSDTNKFTITPDASTDCEFTVTFTASDGVNTSAAPRQFSLSFVTVVTDSNHTTLLATGTNGTVEYYSLFGASYDNITLDTSSEGTGYQVFAFNNDGTKLFRIDSTIIYQYTLTTGFDLSTGSYDNISFTIPSNQGSAARAIQFNNDGTKMYVYTSSNTRISQYALTTGFDLSSASYDNKLYNGTTGNSGFTFNNDGTKLFKATAASKTIETYNLSTAFDISTASDASVSFSTASQTTGTAFQVQFNSDGTKMFVMDWSGGNNIYQYTLTQPYVVSSASYDNVNYNFNSQESSPNNFKFSNDGSKMYIGGFATDRIHQYSTVSHDNNNITDSSSNNHSITVTGDAYAGTFSPYRSGGYATSFSRSDSSKLEIASMPAIGSGDCSIEFWCKIDSQAWNGIISRGAYNSSGTFSLSSRSGDTELTLIWSGTIYTTSGANIEVGKWEWVQVIRSSGTVTIYVNGSSVGSWSNSANVSSTSNYIIGRVDSSDYFGGDLRDLRISTNAQSSSNGSEKLATDSNTTFLSCHLPYLSYATSSVATNTYSSISGTIETVSNSPYDYFEYSTTDHGGSVYFDGSGDKLTVGSPASDFNFGTNSFTIEGWVYSQVAAIGPIFSTHTVGITSGYYLVLLANNSFGWGNYVDGTGDISTAANTIEQNTWNHISLNRDASSSNSLKIYVNGVLKYTGTSSTNYNTFDYGPFVAGNGPTGTQYDFKGYISDLVVVNGSVLRTGGTSVGDVAFTPPATPIATPSNTKLHLKGTDASIIDKSQVNNLKLVGNTTGSTTTNFTGAKSINLTGSNDYLVAESEDILTQDYTIETWIYAPTGGFTATGYVFDTRPQTSTQNGISLYMNSNTAYLRINGGQKITSGTTLSDQNWHHVAISRSGSNTKLFFNGSQTGSTYTVLDTIYSPKFFIGIQSYSASAINGVNAYLQDFRITKGLARYTAADETSNIPSAPLEG